MRNSEHLKAIIFSQHALDQIADRGASEYGVRKTIIDGEEAPAKKGRRAFRKNFPFNTYWKGKHYEVKQVMAIVLKEGEKWVVITVFVFYFGGEKK